MGWKHPKYYGVHYRQFRWVRKRVIEITTSGNSYHWQESYPRSYYSVIPDSNNVFFSYRTFASPPVTLITLYIYWYILALLKLLCGVFGVSGKAPLALFESQF